MDKLTFPNGMPLIPPKPSDVWIGQLVILKGVVRGKVVGGQIFRIHPPKVEMTDLDGSLFPWTGLLPVIDAFCVLPIDALPPDKQDDPSSPIVVQKVAFHGDIEARYTIRNMPAMIDAIAPRYALIGGFSSIL